MRYHPKFYVAAVLFGTSLCWTVIAQTVDAPKKSCVAPRPIYQEDPPPYHVRKNLGIVVLHVFIDEKGLVSDAKVLQSSGSDKFDRDAQSAVKKWKFKPSMCDGKASPADVQVEVQPRVNY